MSSGGQVSVEQYVSVGEGLSEEQRHGADCKCKQWVAGELVFPRQGRGSLPSVM